MGNLTGTVKKHMPTIEALQVLYQRMKYEYDFYNFIHDQFHLTKKKIGLKSASQNSAHEPDFLRELALRTQEPLEEEEDEEEEEDMGQENANIWMVQPWILAIEVLAWQRSHKLDVYVQSGGSRHSQAKIGCVIVIPVFLTGRPFKTLSRGAQKGLNSYLRNWQLWQRFCSCFWNWAVGCGHFLVRWYTIGITGMLLDCQNGGKN